VRHAAPYCDHFGLLWWPFWIQNDHQNTKSSDLSEIWFKFDERNPKTNLIPLFLFSWQLRRNLSNRFRFVWLILYHILLFFFFCFISFFLRLKFVWHISRRYLDQTLWNCVGISYAM
jgi:hypothetical protein